MGKKLSLTFIYSMLFMIGLIIYLGVGAEPLADKKALLDFLHKIDHSPNLNWDRNSSICKKWIGVTCNNEQSHVIGLNLPRAQLKGTIPQNTLSSLSSLQTLNLASNSITGTFPSGFSKLKNLTKLFLQFNNFSGPLPLDFSVWNDLTDVNLANNRFNGTIPFSLLNKTRLESLVLANNSLSGEIPDHIYVSTLKEINFANNKLIGIVPISLQRFPPWVFLGNNVTFSIASPHSNLHQEMKTGDIILPPLVREIIAGIVLGLPVIILIVAIVRWVTPD